MAQSKKRVTDTGNGSTPTPILAGENDPTAAQSQPSQPLTSIESGSTKPLSIPEALSLLQTLCLDLRSMGCAVAILARGKRLYIIGDLPASIGVLSMSNGHITLDGQPVSKIEGKTHEKTSPD